jgi:diguanylate cyclase (GGDEF)-like protein
MSVAMIDLDGFGTFNDAAGMAAGDETLVAFHQALVQNLPADALVHRIGGDEWVVTFPASALENSLVLLEEVRGHVEAAPFGSREHPITMSAGVAARPPHATTGDELVRAADEALSRSKRAGGNRVAIFIEDKMVMKSNYYSRATLDRLAALARATNRTEASLLREAADKLLASYAALI